MPHKENKKNNSPTTDKKGGNEEQGPNDTKPEDNKELKDLNERMANIILRNGGASTERSEANEDEAFLHLLKEKRELRKSVAEFKKHNQDVLVNTARKFGLYGSMYLHSYWSQLHIMQTLLGDHLSYIECERAIQGRHSIFSLSLQGHLAMSKDQVSINSKRHDITYLDECAETCSEDTFLRLLKADEDGDYDYKELKKRVAKEKLDTGLPIQLRFLNADDFPMGEKTRKAHTNWSLQFCQKIQDSIRWLQVQSSYEKSKTRGPFCCTG